MDCSNTLPNNQAASAATQTETVTLPRPWGFPALALAVFINSFGGQDHLYLSNWYLRFEFGRRHLRIPSIIVAAAVLVVGFCLVIGGVTWL